MTTQTENAVSVGASLATILWGVAMLVGWLQSRWWSLVPMLLGVLIIWSVLRSHRVFAPVRRAEKADPR